MESNYKKVVNYLTNQPFRQMSMKQMCKDLEMRPDTCCRHLKYLIDRNRVEKEKIGQRTIFKLL